MGCAGCALHQTAAPIGTVHAHQGPVATCTQHLFTHGPFWTMSDADAPHSPLPTPLHGNVMGWGAHTAREKETSRPKPAMATMATKKGYEAFVGKRGFCRYAYPHTRIVPTRRSGTLGSPAFVESRLQFAPAGCELPHVAGLEVSSVVGTHSSAIGPSPRVVNRNVLRQSVACRSHASQRSAPGISYTRLFLRHRHIRERPSSQTPWAPRFAHTSPPVSEIQSHLQNVPQSAQTLPTWGSYPVRVSPLSLPSTSET